MEPLPAGRVPLPSILLIIAGVKVQVKFYKIDIDNEAVQQAVIENSGACKRGCCSMTHLTAGSGPWRRGGCVLGLLSGVPVRLHFAANQACPIPLTAAQWRRCPPSLATRGRSA